MLVFFKKFLNVLLCQLGVFLVDHNITPAAFHNLGQSVEPGCLAHTFAGAYASPRYVSICTPAPCRNFVGNTPPAKMST